MPHLPRVLIDTGSGSTVVSADLAKSIGIVAGIYRISGVGGSVFVYSKTVGSVTIGDMQVKTFDLEIGAMNDGFDLDGIIGLDLLQQLKATLNIEQLLLYYNS